MVRSAAREVPAYERFLERATCADGTRTEQACLHLNLLEDFLRQDYTLHVRELRRLVLLALEGSSGDRLGTTPALAKELKPLTLVSEIDAKEVERALAACSGNVTQAARALGLPSRFALYRLMKRWGLSAQRA
ncbi:MAG TPA: helix-turn-helix domain-containing protein, partial [Polyangiaceae bacterium]